MSGAHSEEVPARRALISVLLALLAVAVVRTAWISDAAYLTLRTAEHAAAGYGLRWNVVERVQVFDHPLWLLLLAGARMLTGELYYTTIVVSVGLTLICGWLVISRAADERGMVLAGASLLGSTSFVSFSTSGLETPLLHLLVAGAVAAMIADTRSSSAAAVAAALTGMAALTRWQALLCLGPALALLAARMPSRQRWRIAVLAAAPLLLWMAFSFGYYGLSGPISNLADQHGSVGWSERLDHGRSFLLESLRRDPVLAAILIVGSLAGLYGRPMEAALAGGVLLWTSWRAVLGGSPMAGRDLTIPLVVGLLIILRRLTPAPRGVRTAAAACVAGLAVLASAPPLTTGADFGADSHRTARVHDARAADYQATGLLRVNRLRPIPDHPEATRAREAAAARRFVGVSEKSGFFGAAGGPDIYVLDPRGTLDPLLSRLPPSVGSRWNWGAPRRLPEGYLRSLPDNSIALGEPALAALYDRIRRATREPLLSRARLDAMIGLPSYAASQVRASSYGQQSIDWREIAFSRFRTPQSHVVSEQGTVVTLGELRSVSLISGSFNETYEYEISALDGDRVLATVRSPRTGWEVITASERRIAFEKPVRASALRFRCGRGVGPCTLGSLALGH
jgi:arabinofuranosyltransferase